MTCLPALCCRQCLKAALYGYADMPDLGYTLQRTPDLCTKESSSPLLESKHEVSCQSAVGLGPICIFCPLLLQSMQSRRYQPARKACDTNFLLVFRAMAGKAWELSANIFVHSICNTNAEWARVWQRTTQRPGPGHLTCSLNGGGLCRQYGAGLARSSPTN